MKRAVLFALGAMPVDMADAGAWPREEGGVFFSVTHERADSDDWITSLYAEYGLTPNVTLGFDGSTDPDLGEGYAFVQYAFPQGDGPDRFAILGGYGAIGNTDDGAAPISVLGLSWGRGLTYPFGSGWAGVESSVRLRDKDSLQARTLVKVDITLGWQRAERDLVIAQLQSGQESGGEPFAKLVPSYIWHLSDIVQLETGFSVPITDGEEPRVKFGLWTQF